MSGKSVEIVHLGKCSAFLVQFVSAASTTVTLSVRVSLLLGFGCADNVEGCLFSCCCNGALLDCMKKKTGFQA